MAKPLIFLHFVFLLASIFPVNSQQQELLFEGFKGATSNNNISINGCAEIVDNGILRLTNHTNRLGHAFYSTPFHFKNSTNAKVLSFSTAFAFAITNHDPAHGGHGLAFVISPSEVLPGAYPGEYLGLFSPLNVGNVSNHVFAVEFDTVQDHAFRDINGNHVGINLNGMVSEKSVPAAQFTNGSSKQDLDLKSGGVIQAWVDYDSSTTQLDVRLSSTSSKPTSPILSFNVDLSPILQDEMYVGFSASTTGCLASSHYLLGWSFYMNGEAKSLNLKKLPSVPKSKNHKKCFIKLGVAVSVVILTIVALGWVVFMVIRKTKNGDDVTEPWELEVGPQRFQYEELKQATMGFKEKQLIGFGGFGRVYKGVLPNSKTQVAVKRISQNSKEGLQQFMSEIATTVVCGRRPIEPKAMPEELVLVDWALKVLGLGLLCSNDAPAERPSIREVAMCLEGEVPVPYGGDGGGVKGFQHLGPRLSVFDRISMWSCNPKDVDSLSLSS
ncbi:hypothetical protein RJT34_11594 [Clitoria ternatea]|uniref:non-specific serine/threonine protein kinase n=1 Tax=Clitoria ternatea TaxID=43366 RepID=A0AAN9JK84_CLITE